MIKFQITALAILTAVAGCAEYHNDQLAGKWQAVEILEAGKPLEIDPHEIGFSFDSAGAYSYTSTLNYREAGNFYIESNYLFTTDTINRASTEKAVEIIKLGEDSLFLRMMEAGRERTLKLIKIDR